MDKNQVTIKNKTMDKNQVTIWVARDENGKLAVYDSKPDKYEKMKVWMPHGRYDNYIHVSPDLFPSVKWRMPSLRKLY